MPDARATVAAAAARVVVDGLRRLPGLFFSRCWFFFFGATFNATPRSQSRTGAGAAEASASSSWSSSTRE